MELSASPYEIARYQAILNLLGNRSYRVAFEPGCSLGVLTRMLAARSKTALFSPTLEFGAAERIADIFEARAYTSCQLLKVLEAHLEIRELPALDVFIADHD